MTKDSDTLLDTSIRQVTLSRSLFRDVDVNGTNTPLLVVPTPDVSPWDATTQNGRHLLCALGDPNNLGALIRSACAFGVSSLILLEEACHPYHTKVIKSSSGTVFSMSLKKGPSIHDLPKGLELFGLDASGTPLKTLKLPTSSYFLLGEEGQGLPANLKVQKIAIPINSSVESLNATVAASILFYELSLK